jgi:hypothetical protein
MKNQRDKLRQYQKRITVLTDREKAIAKECLARGDTNRAKLALRRKKYQEGLIQKTDAQLAQLEQLTSDVEFALVQKDVLYGLQQGTAVLKEIHREMGGIENVEKLLGENAEARAYQEVSIAATKPTPRVLSCYRKSLSCSRTRCPTKTRTKSRTSSRPSRERSTRPLYCPERPPKNPSSRPNRKRRWHETARNGEPASARLSRSSGQSPCWRSGPASVYIHGCIERGVGVVCSESGHRPSL